MTLRKNETQRKAIGDLIKKHRLCLTDLPRSRQGFIYDRSKKIPSLENIRNLSIALEIDELEFVKEILDLL